MYNIRQVLVISTGDMIENSYMRETQAHNCEFLQSMQIHKATKLIYSLLVALAEDCNVIFGGIAGNQGDCTLTMLLILSSMSKTRR